MRKGFTLIELLVVMMIVAVIMGLVVPRGAKMLDGFEKVTHKIKQEHNLSLDRSYSFISVEEKNVTVQGIVYHITSKGVLSKYEKSDDNY